MFAPPLCIATRHHERNDVVKSLSHSEAMPKRKTGESRCADTVSNKRRCVSLPDPTTPPLQRSSRLQTRSGSLAHNSEAQHHLPSPALSRHSEHKRTPKQAYDTEAREAEQHPKRPYSDQDTRQLSAKGPYDPLGYWAKNQHWPPDFAEKGYDMFESVTSGAFKRLRTTSYSQDVRSGEAPDQYSAAYENWIALKGLDMDVVASEKLLLKESMEFCRGLLKVSRNTIGPILFSQSTLRELLVTYKCRNEGIVNRDVTPLILPPIASLYQAGAKSLQHVVDEANENWGPQCVLAGPRMRPDLAVGLSRSAFTEAEIAKLNVYASPDNWTKFTEKMFFPFLMGEVKCGEGALNVADRQNMHSNSVAIRAILRLVEEADRNRTTKGLDALDGQVLTFSFSHDESEARFYGYFAVTRDEPWSYHRHLIKKFDILADVDGLLGAFNFCQNVLDQHYPVHLKRLQGALADIPESKARSSSKSTQSLGGDSQSDFQKRDPFKKPGRAASSIQNDHIIKLTEQLEQLREESRKKEEKMEQRLENEREESRKRDEKKDQQLEKQQGESRKREEKQQEESRKREEKMEQNFREQLEQQRAQTEQQRAQNEQLNKIIAMLEPSLR